MSGAHRGAQFGLRMKREYGAGGQCLERKAEAGCQKVCSHVAGVPGRQRVRGSLPRDWWALGTAGHSSQE